MQRSQGLSMLSSRVNEVFTQLVHVFIFAGQEEHKTIRCTRIVPI